MASGARSVAKGIAEEIDFHYFTFAKNSINTKIIRSVANSKMYFEILLYNKKKQN